MSSSLPTAGIPSAADIRPALERMLSSRGFAAAPRLARFLRVVVERALEGRASELKESTLAVEVFDRDPSYNPRTDPIVRVQAVRLRSKLVEYYASEGSSEPIIIDLPSPGYTPSFRLRPETSSTPPRTGAPATSIAVLPFADLSPQQNMQYFCDGISEEILHVLAQNPELQVAARTSSFVYKSRLEDVRRIGETLGVANVVEGSVRMAGNRTRITAQLTSARDGFHIWSETFDRELSDIFRLQDEIAAAIARRLSARGAAASPAPLPETGFGTYELVLLARHHFNRQTPADFVKAREYFEQAIARDSNYGPAWTGLALSLVYIAFFNAVMPVSIADEARRAADRAVELGPMLPEAHLALGAVKAVLEFRFHDALAEYEQAIALGPSLSDAYDFYAMGLTGLGREAEALAAVTRARELDPLSARIQENLAFTYLQFRRYDESVAVYRKLLDREPFYPLGWLGLAWNELMLGNPEDALRHIEYVRSYAGDLPFLTGTRGYALARAGGIAEAEHLLNQSTAATSYERALIATGLGDRCRALDLLECAWEERIGWVLFIGVNPLLDPLRGEVRFTSLARRVTGEG